MSMRNFLLTLHILGAIIGFGPTFVFPMVGAMAAKEGAPVPWLLKVNELIEKRLVMPIATLIMPGTGAALIVTQGWNPFEKSGRWLLSALILYTFNYVYSVLVMTKASSRALHLAEAGQYGPEFGKAVGTLKNGGMMLTAFFLVIVILMVTKPGV